MTDTTSRLGSSNPVHALVLPVTIGAQFVLPLSLAGTAVALPSIARDLGSDPSQLQLVINGFNICFAVFTIVWGRLADRIGYRRAFQAGVLTTFVGSAASAAAPTLVLLDLARIVTGVGAAAVLTLAATIISDTFDGPQRARAFTAFGTVSGFGLAAGPAIAGATVSLLGWRAMFALHALLLLLALLGSWALPPGVHDRSETGHPPLLDPVVFRNAAFLRMALVPVAGAIGFVAILTYLPSGLQAIHGWSDGDAAAFMLLMTMPVFVAPVISHRLLSNGRSTAPVLALIALVCLVLGPLGLLAIRPDVSPIAAAVPMILCGLGFGIPLGFVDGEALSHIPPDRAGSAAGVFNLMRIGSEAVFVAAYGGAIAALITSRVADPAAAEQTAAGASGHPDAFTASQSMALIGVSVLCTVVLAAYTWLSRAAKTSGAKVGYVDDGVAAAPVGQA
ncbi:MFS transporter [Mycobacterium sp. PDNC021]|uniref:MFS transporter n=1 Tax=Mycobacterium sp. PDNC021 TaxID=3391399 RepID=UPI003AACEDB6